MPDSEETVSLLSNFYCVKRHINIIKLTEIISANTACYNDLNRLPKFWGRIGANTNTEEEFHAVLCVITLNGEDIIKQFFAWYFLLSLNSVQFLNSVSVPLQLQIIESFKMFSHCFEQVFVIGSSVRCYVGKLKLPICV